MNTEKQKAFELVAEKIKPDPLVIICVAFVGDDEDSRSNISQHFGGIQKIKARIKRKGEKKYIMGTVICLAKKNKANAVSYDFQREDNALGETPIKLAVLIPAIELASKLNCCSENNTTHQRKKRTTGLRSEEESDGAFFSNEICDALFLVDEGEEGEPESSNDNDLYDGLEDEKSSPPKMSDFDAASQRNQDNTYNSTEMESDDASISGGFHWLPVGTIPLPHTLSKRRSSYVRNDYTSYFDTPLSSFLSFIPLKILK